MQSLVILLFIVAAFFNYRPADSLSLKSTVWSSLSGASHTLFVEGDIKIEPAVWDSLSGAQTFTGPSKLDKETFEIVSKFYKDPAYEIEEIIDDGIMVYVNCGEQCVLEAKIGLNGRSSYIGILKTPEGEGTGADLVKLFEAMAKSKGSKSVILCDASEISLFRLGGQSEESNPKIRSTVCELLSSTRVSL
jgi:hypothetical protein